MKTITLTRKDTEENISKLAILKGYEDREDEKQSPEDFVAQYYSIFIDKDIRKSFIKSKRNEMRKKIKEEEDEIIESIDKNKTEAKVS